MPKNTFPRTQTELVLTLILTALIGFLAGIAAIRLLPNQTHPYNMPVQRGSQQQPSFQIPESTLNASIEAEVIIREQE